jgi:hypothetical protein
MKCQTVFPKLHHQFNLLGEFMRKHSWLLQVDWKCLQNGTLNYGITTVLFPLQFSGENAERLKKTYGKFCGQHNQSVNYFKDLYTKDKRFQAFVKVLI